ncbi:MAG: DUF1080 domain-containing protein [Planctomycetes bacterium]|nr:DUF1080 domain-containing protein [Planctomycetota bacterium]
MGAMVLGLMLAGAPAETPFASATIDIGVVVSDLEASMKFYREAIGFVPAVPPSFDVSGAMAKGSGLTDGRPFRVMVLQLPGADGPATKLKLMTFDGVAKGGPGPFLHSSAGVRYLTLIVKDMDAAIARAKAAGAKVVNDGPTPIDPSIGAGAWIALVPDPDGTIIELVGPRGTAASGADPNARPLFNGKDLQGWRPFRNARWEVRDGAIVGEHGNNYNGGWLLTDEQFGDFDLTFRFRITPGANSGVAIRFPGEGSPSKLGVEMQLGDADAEYPTGSLFGLAAAEKGLLRAGEWQEGRIVAAGKTIKGFIDGKEAAAVETDRSARGHIGIQVHTGEIYKGIRVEFKDIRIAEK